MKSHNIFIVHMIFSITVSVLIIVIVIIIVVLMWSLLSPSFSLLSSTFLLSPSVLIVIVIIVITNAALLLCNRPCSPRSLCGSVVKYRRAKSEGLRFDSQRGLRSFSLSHARDKTKKKKFLYPYYCHWQCYCLDQCYFLYHQSLPLSLCYWHRRFHYLWHCIALG